MCAALLVFAQKLLGLIVRNLAKKFTHVDAKFFGALADNTLVPVRDDKTVTDFLNYYFHSLSPFLVNVCCVSGLIPTEVLNGCPGTPRHLIPLGNRRETLGGTDRTSIYNADCATSQRLFCLLTFADFATLHGCSTSYGDI